MSIEKDKTVQEVAVHKFSGDENEMAIFEFEGDLRDLLVSELKNNFLTQGNYVPDAKTISSQSASSLTVAGASSAATALSAQFSSTLFMATANPATLMPLGQGVGSAVMGAKGILAQAPFLPVASTLPIVAPILAVQALNTALIMKQFKQVDEKLATIKHSLDKVLARIEATHAGELLAASWVVDEIYVQYEDGGKFSTDMLLRLALAERDVRALAARFKQLVDSRNFTNFADLSDVQQANYDAHSAILSSFLELRIAYLRMSVDMQENPKSVVSSTAQLKNKIDQSIVFWEKLLERSVTLKTGIEELEEKLQDMKWAKRNLPTFFGGEGASTGKDLQMLKDAYTSTMESEREIMKGFLTLIDAAKVARSRLETSSSENKSPATLVYWKDDEGEHSFVTERSLIA